MYVSFAALLHVCEWVCERVWTLVLWMVGIHKLPAGPNFPTTNPHIQNRSILTNVAVFPILKRLDFIKPSRLFVLKLNLDLVIQQITVSKYETQWEQWHFFLKIAYLCILEWNVSCLCMMVLISNVFFNVLVSEWGKSKLYFCHVGALCWLLFKLTCMWFDRHWGFP